MVDTQDLANAVTPYQSDKDRFDKEESLEIVDDLFRRYGFAQTDSLVYHLVLGADSSDHSIASREIPFIGQSVPVTQTLAELNEVKNLWT